MVSAILVAVFGHGVSESSYGHLATWAHEQRFVRLSEWIWARWAPVSVHDKPDVVIAQFREDLSWLHAYMDHINHLHVYCKDNTHCLKGLDAKQLPARQLTVHMLPNVGRESHTYLTHIISYYHQLGRRTVFAMASSVASDLRRLSFLEALENKGDAYMPMPDHQGYMHYQVSPSLWGMPLGDSYRDKRDRRYHGILPAYPRPLYAWLRYHTGINMQTHPRKVRVSGARHGAIFSVTRDTIRRHDVSVYQRLLHENTKGDLLEAGFYMERVWRYLFS